MPSSVAFQIVKVRLARNSGSPFAYNYLTALMSFFSARLIDSDKSDNHN